MRTRILLCALLCLVVAAPLVAQGPPSSSGPIVVRGEFNGGDSDYWWGITDMRTGYIAVHGVDLVSWCMMAPVGYTVWDFQDNFPPAEEGLVHELLKADDVLTSVWPVSILDEPDFCVPVLAMGAPIAEGTVDFLLNDNDSFAWLYEHNRADAYHISTHGLVYTPDGERMVLNSSFQCVWRMDDPIPGTHCNARVILK